VSMSFLVITVNIVLIALWNRKFWEELISYFPLIWHGPHRKWKN
jgi:hypothetical protein